MKLILIILGLYTLYYLGNIIYDLFLRKEKVVETENNEQNFSLSEFAEQEHQEPVSVNIEDVENIKMPKSFEGEDNIFLSANEEPQNLEALQKKYETESHLYKEDVVNNEDKALEETQEQKTSITDKPIKSINLQNIINDINTRVKIVANYEGQKVYHIQ